MKLRGFTAACAAALLAFCVGGAASAAGLEQEFSRICTTARTPAEAAANARAAGYVAAPDNIKKRLRGFPTGGEVLWRTAEGEMTMFITAKKYQAAGGPFSQPVMTEFCAVASVPAQADVDAKLGQLLGVGQKQTLGRSATYLYTQTAEGRTRVSASSMDLTKLSLAGDLRMVSAMTQRDQTAVMQIATRMPTDVERKTRR